MKNEIRFGAPWATVVIILTAFVIALMAGIALIGLFGLPDRTPFFGRVLMIFIPPAVLAGTLPFMVLGYILRENELLIERLGWANHVPLNTVVSAMADPDAIRGSIRPCGR